MGEGNHGGHPNSCTGCHGNPIASFRRASVTRAGIRTPFRSTQPTKRLPDSANSVVGTKKTREGLRIGWRHFGGHLDLARHGGRARRSGALDAGTGRSFQVGSLDATPSTSNPGGSNGVLCRTTYHCRVKRSEYKFGLSGTQWDEAKEQVRRAIVSAASVGRMTHYGEVAAAVTVTKLDPHSGLMNHLLGEIFEEEATACRPALTAIVAHKYGDKEPGTGFYDMARKLGYRFDDPLIFWSMQVDEIFKLYGQPQRS